MKIFWFVILLFLLLPLSSKSYVFTDLGIKDSAYIKFVRQYPLIDYYRGDTLADKLFFESSNKLDSLKRAKIINKSQATFHLAELMVAQKSYIEARELLKIIHVDSLIMGSRAIEACNSYCNYGILSSFIELNLLNFESAYLKIKNIIASDSNMMLGYGLNAYLVHSKSTQSIMVYRHLVYNICSLNEETRLFFIDIISQYRQ